MNLNYLAIIIATILQFMCGAIWYTAVFGKAWGKIHDFDKYSKAEQEKMMKAIMPWYGVQLVLTMITTTVLAIVLNFAPASCNAFCVAAVLWIGFVVPTQASAVIFGGTPAQWLVQKLAIMAGGSLACLMVAAAVFTLL